MLYKSGIVRGSLSSSPQVSISLRLRYFHWGMLNFIPGSVQFFSDWIVSPRTCFPNLEVTWYCFIEMRCNYTSAFWKLTMMPLQLKVRGWMCEAAYTHLKLCRSMRWEETGVMIFIWVSAWFCLPQLWTILCIVAEGNLLPAENYRFIGIWRSIFLDGAAFARSTLSADRTLW